MCKEILGPYHRSVNQGAGRRVVLLAGKAERGADADTLAYTHFLAVFLKEFPSQDFPVLGHDLDQPIGVLRMIPYQFGQRPHLTLEPIQPPQHIPQQGLILGGPGRPGFFLGRTF